MLDTCLSTLRVFFYGGTVLALTISSALAQSIDDSWTADLATVGEITAYFSDRGELDNSARQYVAFETIHYALEEKVGARIYSKEVTPREKAALDTFREAKNDADMAMHSKYQQADNERYLEYQQRRADFRSDETNLYDILERFAPPLLSVMAPKIAAQAANQHQHAARKLDRIVQQALWILFWAFLSIVYLYLLVGSWRDKRTRLGVEVENFDDKTIITYKPGKHGPIAAMSIYPLYINIVLFMATISVGLVFMLAAAERSEWFQNFLSLPMPQFMQILFYKAFWVGLGLIILFAPWWFLAIANFRRRKGRRIAVTRDAIIAGRNTCPLNMMRSFYVRGYGDGSPEARSRAPDIALTDGSVAGRAAASGEMHAGAIQDSAGLFQRKLGRVSNKIMADYGEQQIALAKWLPWKRAEILHAEIVNALERLRGDESAASSGQ